MKTLLITLDVPEHVTLVDNVDDKYLGTLVENYDWRVVPDASAGELPERNTHSLAGWINELRLLGQHPDLRYGWLRSSIKTIHAGLSQYATPQSLPEVKEE